MGNLENHARFEMEKAGLFDKDSDYGGMLGHTVMRMMKCFTDEGHSGFNARMAISIFKKLANFEPLTPLTGEDDEWNEVGNDLFQNKRCFRIFKDKERAYDSEGKMFRKKNGVCYTFKNSHVDITFPYMPKTEYVDAPTEKE